MRSAEFYSEPFRIPHSAFRIAMMVQTIRVGHTPDMDDAFMFYGIASGIIPMDGFRFEHVVEDIQSLNRRAFS